MYSISELSDYRDHSDYSNHDISSIMQNSIGAEPLELPVEFTNSDAGPCGSPDMLNTVSAASESEMVNHHPAHDIQSQHDSTNNAANGADLMTSMTHFARNNF